jgi:hypothetical protein
MPSAEARSCSNRQASNFHNEPYLSWRPLKLTFRDSVATLCPERVFHVGGDGLISQDAPAM